MEMKVDTLPQRLRDFRQKGEFSQRQLAAKAGIYHPTICHIETGKYLPTLTTLHKLAEALNVPTADLLI